VISTNVMTTPPRGGLLQSVRDDAAQKNTLVFISAIAVHACNTARAFSIKLGSIAGEAQIGIGRPMSLGNK